MLGKKVDVLFSPLQKEPIMQAIETAMKGEKWKTVEIPILCKGKETKFALWNSANITDKEGKITATIAQGQNITERKKLERELIKGKAHLEHMLRSSSAVIYCAKPSGDYPATFIALKQSNSN